MVLAAYRDFEDRVNIISKKLTSRDMVINAINSKIGRFTKTDILEFCPKIGRATVENILKELVKEDYICKIGGGRNASYFRKK